MSVRVLQSIQTAGRFGNGFYQSQGTAAGRAWVRRAGCYNLYRGTIHSRNIDYEHILVTTAAAGEVNVPAYLNHETGIDYFYAVRRVSGSGREERNTTAVVRIRKSGT